MRARVQGVQQGLKRVAGGLPRAEYILWSVFPALSCVFLWSALSGPRGAVELVKLRKELKRLKAENRAMLLENQALEKETYLLRNSRAYVEKVAREEYGYTYDGEKVYTFSDADSSGEPGTEDEGGRGAETSPPWLGSGVGSKAENHRLIFFAQLIIK